MIIDECAKSFRCTPRGTPLAEKPSKFSPREDRRIVIEPRPISELLFDYDAGAFCKRGDYALKFVCYARLDACPFMGTAQLTFKLFTNPSCEIIFFVSTTHRAPRQHL